MMDELVLNLGEGALTRDDDLRPLFEVIGMFGFSGGRYDLNQKENWRAWDLDHAVVDALTQRTQLFRAEASDGAMAMVALGKHGEPPTAILRVADMRIDWGNIFEVERVRSAHRSSAAWRSTLMTDGISTNLPQVWAGRNVPDWAHHAGLKVEPHGQFVLVNLEGTGARALREIASQFLA